MADLRVDPDATDNPHATGFPAGNAILITGSTASATTITVSSAAGLEVGHILRWDTLGASEIRRITNVSGTTVTVNAAITTGSSKQIVVGGTLTTLTRASNVLDALINAGVLLHTVYVKTGTYNETLTLGKGGSTALPTFWRGYESTPGDACPSGAKVVVHGQNTRTNCLVGGTGDATLNTHFYDFHFTRATSSNIALSNRYNLSFFRCISDWAGNGTVSTARGLHGSDRFMIYDCLFANNGGSGCEVVGYSNVVNCISHDNQGERQILLGYYSTAENCLAYGLKNAGNVYGIAGSTSAWIRVRNCTVDGSGSASGFGVWNTVAGGLLAEGNIVVNCLNGIGQGGAGYWNVSFHNLVHNCTNPWVNTYYENALAADPLFVDAANRDYRLQPNSPARRAGHDGSDLGYIPTPVFYWAR